VTDWRELAISCVSAIKEIKMTESQDKILTMYFKKQRLGNAFQRFLFNFGFVWKDNNIAMARNLGENDFYMVINLTTGKMEYVPGFIGVNTPPERIVELKTMYVDEDFDNPAAPVNHPIMAKIVEVLNVYRKPLPVVPDKKPLDKPNPKFDVIIKKRFERKKEEKVDVMDCLGDLL
jgi:hypothetical protein